MKRFFSQRSPRRSREEIEREAAAELAAATGLGTFGLPGTSAGTQDAEPPSGRAGADT